MSANKRDSAINSHPDYTPVDPKQMVSGLISTLQFIVSSNEGTEMPPVLANTYSVYSSPWTYDWATVEEYLNRLLEWIVCGPECFIVAMCMLKKLEAVAAVPPITQTSVHRVYLTCLMMAVKFVEDETLCNADFAKVGCVAVAELNKMERSAFLALDCNVCVSPEEYEVTKAEIEYLDNCILKNKKKLMNGATLLTLIATTCPQNSKKFRWSLTNKKESAVRHSHESHQSASSEEKRFSISLFKKRASKRLSMEAAVGDENTRKLNTTSMGKPNKPKLDKSTSKPKMDKRPSLSASRSRSIFGSLKKSSSRKAMTAKKPEANGPQAVAYFNRQDSL